MGNFDLPKMSKKMKKRRTLRENKRRGKKAEYLYRATSELSGKKVRRTGKGSDYYEEKMGTYVEVKSGKGKLSKLQKETKRKKGKKYNVKRYDFDWV